MRPPSLAFLNALSSKLYEPGYSALALCMIEDSLNQNLIWDWIELEERRGQPREESLQQIDLASRYPEPRRTEWFLGRQALTQAARSLPEGGHTPVHSSLTHSMGVIVGLASSGQKSVGIDLERTDRSLSQKALERITLPSEREMGWPAIAYWVVKEACFKSSPHSDGRVSWEHRTVAFDTKTGIGEAELDGNLTRQRFIWGESDGWTVAFAEGSGES